MPFDYIPPLFKKSNAKIVLLVMDGLGGLPMQAGGDTELETARTPNMDHLAAEGTLGQTIPIRPGITPGSGPAHLALFGYDPIHYEIGRGVLEAFGIGLHVGKGEVAARGNFATLDADGNITDRRAGRIATEEAKPIVEKLKQIKIPGIETDVEVVKEYRFALVLRGPGLSPEIHDTDPQKTGVPPLRAVAYAESARHTAELVNQWIKAAHEAIKDEPKANGLTLRGFSTDPELPTFKDSYDLTAACVAVYPMYKGVSKLVGMQVLEFSGDQPADEFSAVKAAWNDFDFFFVHIKKTDSMGEDGNFAGKVGIIESVDAAIPGLLELKPDVLIITGDHSTPCLLRSHSWHPVPFLLWAPSSIRPDTQTRFGERFCATGGFGTIPALDTIPLALAHAQRLNKFGA